MSTSQKFNITRRSLMQSIAVLGAASGGLVSLNRPAFAQDPIRLGFLTALTGLETILGETQLNCFKLAVDEINANGGVSGRQVEYFVEDDQTTTRGAIEKSRKLIGEDKVDAIIGLIASLEHVAARSVTGRANKLLMYTTYYEGEVCEPTFFATGQVPSQQIVPTTKWLMDNVGKSIYVMGSDYVWPRRSADALKVAAETYGGKIVGAEFFPFGTQDFGPALNRAQEANADIVWMMIAGADNITALKQYQSFGMKAQLFSPLDETFSFSHPDLCEGVLSTQSYFMSVKNPKNEAFVKAYQAKFGEKKPVNAIGEAAYIATWLYAKAVEKAGTTETDAVVKALCEVDFDAPQGHVNFSKSNHHLRTNSLIGKARADGEWEIIKDFGQLDPEIPGCQL